MNVQLSAPNVAWLVKVDVDTIKGQINKGNLIAMKIGSRWIIEGDDLLDFLLESSKLNAGNPKRDIFRNRWIERIQVAEGDYRQHLQDVAEAEAKSAAGLD